MTESPEERGSSLRIEIDGEVAEFSAFRYANKFLLVKLLPDIDKAGIEQLTALTKLAESQVMPHDRSRLASWLEDHGQSDNYAQALWDALDGCWSGETYLPLALSSDSSEPTSDQEPDPGSTDDSPSEGIVESDPIPVEPPQFNPYTGSFPRS